MDDREIRVQIAIGTLPSAPHILAKVIRKTDSIDLVKWALKHKSVKVRSAAIENRLCSDIDFIRVALFDSTVGIHNSVMKVAHERRGSIEALLNAWTNPQLELELDASVPAANEP